MNMEKTVVFNHASGLHARPATKLVKTANRFPCDITIGKGGETADARNIIAILALGIQQGDSVTIVAAGQQEEEAIREVANLLELQ